LQNKINTSYFWWLCLWMVSLWEMFWESGICWCSSRNKINYFIKKLYRNSITYWASIYNDRYSYKKTQKSSHSQL